MIQLGAGAGRRGTRHLPHNSKQYSCRPCSCHLHPSLPPSQFMPPVTQGVDRHELVGQAHIIYIYIYIYVDTMYIYIYIYMYVFTF